MNALEISHFSKVYERGNVKAVDDLSLTIPKGEFFGLLGQNGAGKTTTLHCITGISKFKAGKITVFGTDVVTDYKKARHFIGLSPQDFNVDIFASPEKILDYVGGYFGMPKLAREKRINEMLDEFDLQEHRRKPFQALSGGLKRRCVLARAMMHNPEIIILDEPTAGVDVQQRYQLWGYLQKLHQAGKTIILTSHYLEEVERMCSRVGIIHRGRLIKILQKSEFTGAGQTLEKVYLELTGGKEHVQ